MPESPVFAISYARANIEDSDHRSAMVSFIAKLSSEVAQELGLARKDGVCFVDYDNLQVGSLWDDSLATALKESRVGVALYSPSYFTSEWCGREFQVFLDRCGKKGEHASGIIPFCGGRLPPSTRKHCPCNTSTAPSRHPMGNSEC